MIPSTVLQEAVALLTVAMDAKHTSDLRALVAEYQARDDPEELLLAVVGLCRSLCLASSKLIHTLDDALTDAEAGSSRTPSCSRSPCRWFSGTPRQQPSVPKRIAVKGLGGIPGALPKSRWADNCEPVFVLPRRVGERHAAEAASHRRIRPRIAMATHNQPLRSDAEIRALLQILTGVEGVCGDTELRRELVNTGFVRRDAVHNDRLHHSRGKTLPPRTHALGQSDRAAGVANELAFNSTHPEHRVDLRRHLTQRQHRSSCIELRLGQTQGRHPARVDERDAGEVDHDPPSIRDGQGLDRGDEPRPSSHVQVSADHDPCIVHDVNLENAHVDPLSLTGRNIQGFSGCFHGRVGGGDASTGSADARTCASCSVIAAHDR